jgi:hypothetical protein
VSGFLFEVVVVLWCVSLIIEELTPLLLLLLLLLLRVSAILKG